MDDLLAISVNEPLSDYITERLRYSGVSECIGDGLRTWQNERFD